MTQKPCMRVLHIIKSLGRGGAEMLLSETLRIHDQKQFEFHYIYFLPWKNQLKKELTTLGGKVTCVNAGNNIAIIFKAFAIVKYVRVHKIQLMHAHLPWAGIVARLVGVISGLPVLYTEHNKQERYHFITRFFNLATMNLLKFVVAVSSDVEKSIFKYKPSLKTQVKTILNGVNTDRFRKGALNGGIKKALNIPSDSPVIGTVAVFRFQKRLDVWLAVAAAIFEKHPEVHFIIVGDGPLKSELYKKSKLLGIDHVVHFTGLQTEVRPYLNAMDIYMMTSVFEGLPIALLEAMSMSLAVISTDAGGIKEVIRHEQDGLLCSVEHPELLVHYADRLLINKSESIRLGEAARQRVKHNFSLDAMVRQMETLYCDIYSCR